MKSFWDNVRRQVKDFWGKMERKERIRLLVLAILIIGFSTVVAVFLGRTNYAVLYSGLPEDQAGQVLAALDELGVPSRTRGSNTILVPEKQVDALQMTLANQGFLGTGMSTDIYAQASGFGMTDEERRTYYAYQTGANLRTMINMMERIEDSQVLITLPKDSSFVLSDNNQPATATVMLVVANGGTLSQAEVEAIINTVKGAVQGIDEDHIKIVDSRMTSYSLDGELSLNATLDYQAALTEKTRADLQQQVITFLAPVFGAENISVSVGVTLNFDTENIVSVVFEPPVDGSEEGLVVSYRELYEQTRNATDEGGIPGGDTEGMNLPEYPYYNDDPDVLYMQYVMEANMELNETRSQIERAQGTISALSIGVMINSEVIEGDYTQQVTSLLSSSLGINELLVQVENLPFREAASEFGSIFEDQNSLIERMQNRELIKLIIIIAAVILILVLIFIFVRTLVRGLNPQPQMAVAGAGANIDYVLGSTDGTEEDEAEEFGLSSKPEGVMQIEKFIEKDPQAVAQLLRNWLSDEIR